MLLQVLEPGQYENIDTFFEKKLGHELGKDLGYGAGSESDGPLDSHTNIPKTKCFNSGAVKVSSLGLCDFGSAIDNINIDLPSLVLLESPLCSITSVKERLCFKPTKFFALDIGLLAIPGTTLCDKLKGVRKLFYKVDGFEGVLILLKFPDWEIVIKEILVDLPKLAIKSALVKYGKIFSIKIQLIGLWQKALVEFKSSQVADLVVSK
ncbi:hypothetical protein G9A89_007712 [Geosiphon pyriformis]|nr:hypothetical protein G9A89_007712 [Geosiphon pyriformis]